MCFLMEDEVFWCKKCRKQIGGHNKYLHDCMCNDCYFDEYFPEEAQVRGLDISEFSKLLHLDRKQNEKFREFTKFGGFGKKAFKKIVREIEQKIDCTKCGNCCKVLSPALHNPDIKQLSAYLNLKEEDFVEKYLEKDQEGDFVFKQKPCVFLQDNKCQVYEIRPEECKQYPHLNKNVSDRTLQFLSNAKICPIVFNVLENAKEEFLEDIYRFEHPDEK